MGRHPFKGKNVLVTGGAGLVGQTLVRKLLDQGACVRATQYKSRKIEITHKDLEVVTCDLTDHEAADYVFKDMDMVFLGAARVGGAKANQESASELIMYNLGLSSSLISMAAKHKLEKCSFISSSFVYTDKGDRTPYKESAGFEGHPTVYGLGWIKRYLETLCAHFHVTSGTRYAIIRPTAYYGPHDKYDTDTNHVIPALIMRAMSSAEPFEIWGDGKAVRCFTYVEDLVEGLLLTTEKYAVAEALNICTKETHTIDELVEIIFDELNFHPNKVYRLDKPTSLPYVVSDPSLAKEVLGWEAKTSLREGIKKTLRGELLPV